MPETWRLLRTFRAEPGFNMALDEALLALGGPEPVLRFYTFEPAALSLGYFQRFDEVPEARRASAVVRRPTGGGAIHHQNELTFSLALAGEHPLVRGDVRDSYRRIHAALAQGLAELGAAARPRGAAALLSDRPVSGMCFKRSHPLDLVWGGRKGVGSAQRRAQGRVLHHGSIKLGRSALDDTVAGLEGLAGPEELARRLAPSLARELGIELAPDEPRPAELEHARRRAAYFTSSEFVHRR